MGLFLTQRISNKDDKVFPLFTYAFRGKKTRVFSGINCKIDDWDLEKKKVKRGDVDHKLKNLSIDTTRSKLESIVNRYKVNDEILTVELFKLEIQKIEYKKESKSISALPLLILIQDWEREYLSDKGIENSTKKKTKSVVKDIKTYIEETENKTKRRLMIDDLNDDFSRDFMVWLFNKPMSRNRIDENGEIEPQRGLQPHTVSRRFQYLLTFCKWYRKQSKEYITVKMPRELKRSLVVSDDEDPIFLFQKELQKVVEFTDFDYRKPITHENGEIEWIDSNDYYKHLKRQGDNQSSKKKGVLSLIHEKTRYGLIPYTTYEVYKDIFVFLCSVGCRYGDAMNMKVGNFHQTKRRSTSTIEKGVEGYFKYYQAKTKTESIPRINEVSFQLYKKYSRGKKRSDYLFPRTEMGNVISDVKFNKHIKIICEIIGLNRSVTIRKLGLGGKEIRSQTLPLHKVISSHSGRRSYIYHMVMDGNYNTQELKRMVGHRTDRIFHSYYKLKEEIHNKPNTPFLKSLKSDSNSILSTPIENTESNEVSRIDKLKEDFKQGLISKELFEKMYEKLMMS